MMTTCNTHHARPQRHAVPAPIVRLAARVGSIHEPDMTGWEKGGGCIRMQLDAQVH